MVLRKLADPIAFYENPREIIIEGTACVIDTDVIIAAEAGLLRLPTKRS
jgi:hypothetical protein